jgi:hypothetical protein
VTVKSNLYAKYYFELRALFKDNEKEFPLKPINKTESDRLEIRSREYKDVFEGAAEKGKKQLASSFATFKSKNPWD